MPRCHCALSERATTFWTCRQRSHLKDNTVKQSKGPRHLWCPGATGAALSYLPPKFLHLLKRWSFIWWSHCFWRFCSCVRKGHSNNALQLFRNRSINKTNWWLPERGRGGAKWVKGSGRHRLPDMEGISHGDVGNRVSGIVPVLHGDR